MPIVASTRKSGPYVATGGQTVFPYTFPIVAANEIHVYKNGTLLTLSAHYNVTGVGLSAGNIVLTTGATANDSIFMHAISPYSQNTDYEDHGPFPAEAHEEGLDKLTRIVQELRDGALRAPLLPPYSTLSLTMPEPSSLTLAAGGRKAVVYNEAENNLSLVELTTETGLLSDDIPSILEANLPAAGEAGRLRHLSDVGRFAIDTGATWIQFTPGNEMLMPATTRGSLPSAGGANTGKLRYLTDAPLAVAVSDGIDWKELPVDGVALLAGHTSAGLPTASPSGQMKRVTDGFKGLALSDGTEWIGVNAPVYVLENAAGADFGAKLNALMAQIPATGGTVDARSWFGAHTATATITINKPIKLLLGEITLTSSASTIFHITATGPVVFEGICRSSTFIRTTAVGQTAIHVHTEAPVRLAHFTIDHSGSTKNSGSGIYVDAPTSSNGFSRFYDLNIVDQYVSISFIEASGWAVVDCYIVNSAGIGIDVSNTFLPDAGDSTIYGCVFDSAHVDVNVAAIFQRSSGGLRVINNKILSHYYGYVLDIAGTTVILELVGNSIENQAGPSVALGRSSGTAIFNAAKIHDNQMTNINDACIAISSQAIGHVTIQGNTMSFLSPNAGISLSAVSGCNVYGNMFISDAGTSKGIAIGADALAVDVGPNTYYAVNTPVDYQNTSSPYTSLRALVVTTAMRDLIPHEAGLREIVYNITAGKFQGWSGSAWVDFH